MMFVSQFPAVNGTNLNDQRMALPADFDGVLNVVFIRFTPDQQFDMLSWFDLVQTLEHNTPRLRYYQLRLPGPTNPTQRVFIFNGMRAGTRDMRVRDRTVVLYPDKANFLDILGLPDDERVYVLLVQPDGSVLWRSQGALTPEKRISMLDVIETVLG